MQAVIERYETKRGVSDELKQYTFYTTVTDGNDLYKVVETTHYGPDRNTCLVAAIRQLRREFKCNVTIDKMKLWSGIKAGGIKIQMSDADDKETYLSLEYQCNEPSDTFVMPYKYIGNEDPAQWKDRFLKYVDPKAEYFKYLSGNTVQGYEKVHDVLSNLAVVNITNDGFPVEGFPARGEITLHFEDGTTEVIKGTKGDETRLIKHYAFDGSLQTNIKELKVINITNDGFTITRR